MPSIRRIVLVLSMTAVVGTIWSCASSDENAAHPMPAHVKALSPIATPGLAEDKPKDYPGIHNAVAYHAGFISGSQPEGDAGFDTLAAMGVKTIISVDGATPEVEKARAHGMRYIHLPIGYNGFDEERKLELTRATRDAIEAGPVYIHCHHGKHRAAGAAAAVAASMGWLTPEQGVARMRVSGTAPNYTGLYACAQTATVLSADAIDAVPADFPEVSKPSSYVQGMVDIDHAFEHLKAIEKAGWAVPSDHPDLVPVAEAGRLADLYRVLHDTGYVKGKPSEFAAMMTQARTHAQALEDLLAAGEKDKTRLSAQFKLVSASCKNCHAKYRD
ncbi:MAG: hypothetical protein EDM82_15295 [Cyanobacteria bacterium CYA]|nr:MAG: hypothetical protein EDM82_15295 [Cyanobacteria bacterium CYA]